MFAHLVSLNITDKTADYTLHLLAADPRYVLIVKPTGAENKPYFNALLREFGGAGGVQKLRGAASVEVLEKVREVNRRLFPLHVVAGWKHVMDEAGKPVPFSAGACQQFFDRLPGYTLDDLKAFCDEPANFIATPPVDVEALAGN